MKGPREVFFYKEEDIQNEKNSYLTAYLSLIHNLYFYL